MTTLTELKVKSIDNYQIMNKRCLLYVNNILSSSPLTLCNIMVKEGKIENRPIKSKSNQVVELDTHLLKVAILEEINEDLDESCLKNYEGETTLIIRS